MAARTFHVLGVPLRSGSLMPGTENDAPAYRKAGLLDNLPAAIDEGDLPIPSYLPHHTVPPLRNWPGPRIVWDLLASRIEPWLREPGHVPLLIGCDCSVVIATAQALSRAADSIHVLYIDGDFDDAPPDPAACQSAAAMAIWLVTNPSPFCAGPPLPPAQVTVFGWSKPSRAHSTRVNSVSLADIRRLGVSQAIQGVLAGIPASASILVHFDIDVFADDQLPAAYFPHTDGLTIDQGREVLRTILPDPRVRLIEISEYSTLRDLDGASARRLVEMVAAAAAC